MEGSPGKFSEALNFITNNQNHCNKCFTSLKRWYDYLVKEANKTKTAKSEEMYKTQWAANTFFLKSCGDLGGKDRFLNLLIFLKQQKRS